MRYSDTVTILRAANADEYGNPGRSWATPTETAAKAFVPGKRETAFLPAGTDLLEGDRLRLADGVVFDVTSAVVVRSPSKVVLVKAALSKVQA